MAEIGEDFEGASGAPFFIKGIEIPKLSVRNIGKIAALVKSSQVASLRSLIKEEEGVLPEAKARFLAITVARDFNIQDVWEWCVSIEGGLVCVEKALVQSGKSEAEAARLLDTFSPEELLDAAMECTAHFNSKSKVALRKLEAKKPDDSKKNNPSEH